MKLIKINKRAINIADYQGQPAKLAATTTIVDQDCFAFENGASFKFIYFHLTDDVDTSELEYVIKKHRYNWGKRTNRSVKTQSAIFGYRPASRVRRLACDFSAMAYSAPREHAVLCNFAEKLYKHYRKRAPKVSGKHTRLLHDPAQGLPVEMRMGETPFTSGIVNKNSPICYHYDSGNIENVYSCMVGFRSGATGGYLVSPEYDIAFKIDDRSVLIFDGQKILHGVSDIYLQHADGYRFTIVYYTLKKIWECLTA